MRVCFLLFPTKEISIENSDSKLKPEMNAAKRPINIAGILVAIKKLLTTYLCFDLEIVQIFI